MGKLKNRLIELEDSGVIRYSEDLECFIKVGGDPTQPFQLGDYKKPMPVETEIITMPSEPYEDDT